jgi:hypothetical protein
MKDLPWYHRGGERGRKIKKKIKNKKIKIK